MGGYEIADKIARDGSVQSFVGHETFLGVYSEDITRKKKPASGIVSCSL